MNDKESGGEQGKPTQLATLVEVKAITLTICSTSHVQTNPHTRIYYIVVQNLPVSCQVGHSHGAVLIYEAREVIFSSVSVLCIWPLYNEVT